MNNINSFINKKHIQNSRATVWDNLTIGQKLFYFGIYITNSGSISYSAPQEAVVCASSNNNGNLLRNISITIKDSYGYQRKIRMDQLGPHEFIFDTEEEAISMWNAILYEAIHFLETQTARKVSRLENLIKK
jgi:hypothetical protein